MRGKCFDNLIKRSQSLNSSVPLSLCFVQSSALKLLASLFIFLCMELFEIPMNNFNINLFSMLYIIVQHNSAMVGIIIIKLFWMFSSYYTFPAIQGSYPLLITLNNFTMSKTTLHSPTAFWASSVWEQ